MDLLATIALILLPVMFALGTNVGYSTGKNEGTQNGKNQAIIVCNEQPKICQAQYQVLKFEETKK